MTSSVTAPRGALLAVRSSRGGTCEGALRGCSRLMLVLLKASNRDDPVSVHKQSDQRGRQSNNLVACSAVELPLNAVHFLIARVRRHPRHPTWPIAHVTIGDSAFCLARGGITC